VLKELELSEEQFVDLCILCGCDYTPKIGGVGPVRALGLIRKHGCMERVLEALQGGNYQVPEDFPYQEARRLFKGAGGRAGQGLPPLLAAGRLPFAPTLARACERMQAAVRPTHPHARTCFACCRA
jgi:hypothetical protein